MKAQMNPAMEWFLKNPSLMRLMDIDPFICRRLNDIEIDGIKVHVYQNEMSGEYFACYSRNDKLDTWIHGGSFDEIRKEIEEAFEIHESSYDLALSA